MTFRGYGWYLSSTATLLYISYWLHNLVAWLKIRPFFKGTNAIFSAKMSKIITWIYLITLGLSIVPLTFQIVNNFLYFNNIGYWYPQFRPYETLMRYVNPRIDAILHAEIMYTETLGGCSSASCCSA